MTISCWGDLAIFISHMSLQEKGEPIRIVVDDKPIVIAREVDKAKDFYIRPKGEQIIGYEQKEVEINDHLSHISNWERTLDKGDVFITAY